MLELIIERGCQLLQTSEGEKLPRVVETLVRQKMAEPGLCQFTIHVNSPGCCRYDDQKKQVATPAGQTLKTVRVLKFKPAESELIPALVLCECHVSFHYNTSHRPHFAARPVAGANATT